ncbi:MAG TPA: DUF1848 domain-containing protein [Patescibacteria group bacterium]|nr:DUF1848 domain-containing protein [Patescibacteria group bacterium]
MIVSASVRTDIPAFYGPWFRNRFRAGFARVASPYGGPVSTVPLRQGVDGMMFWTRNIGPFLPMLDEVAEAGMPFIVQYTVTGYPRALESSVVGSCRSVSLIRQLAERFGPRAVVWRYDPIVVSDLTPPAWHVNNFTALARTLEGSVDEVVVSFVQSYRKTARNMATATQAHGFTWGDPATEEKRQAIARLADIARGFGMALTLCTQPDLAIEGVAAARCIDAQRLADVAGHPIIAKTKGNRPGCLCAESRDIGAYDSCPHGCAYCYAVNRPGLAKARFHAHDPLAEMLVPGDGDGMALQTPGPSLL